jgi:hypothetical protein
LRLCGIHVSAGRAQLFGERLERDPVSRDDTERRVLLGEPRRDSAPHASGGAGDYDDFVGERSALRPLFSLSINGFAATMHGTVPSQVKGGVDEAEMGHRLGKISEQKPA